MLKHILFTCLLSFSVTPLLKAQNCGNDEIYHLPYKNTYASNPQLSSSASFLRLNVLSSLN